MTVIFQTVEHSRGTILQGRKCDCAIMIHPEVPTHLKLLLGQVIHANDNLVLLILRMACTDNYTKQRQKYEDNELPRVATRKYKEAES